MCAENKMVYSTLAMRSPLGSWGGWKDVVLLHIRTPLIHIPYSKHIIPHQIQQCTALLWTHVLWKSIEVQSTSCGILIISMSSSTLIFIDTYKGVSLWLAGCRMSVNSEPKTWDVGCTVTGCLTLHKTLSMIQLKRILNFISDWPKFMLRYHASFLFTQISTDQKENSSPQRTRSPVVRFWQKLQWVNTA